MNDKLKETRDTGPDGLSLVHLRVSEDAQVQIAVAYLRTSARGAERAWRWWSSRTRPQRLPMRPATRWSAGTWKAMGLR